MPVEAAIAWIDRVLVLETGKHLNDLQILTIERVWQGQKYVDIAAEYHCTEGHIKDSAAVLWQLLSQSLGEKVTKTNLKAIVQRHVDSKITELPQLVNYRFIGREAAMAELQTTIDRGDRSIAIQGEGGIGKTTLAQEFLKTCGCQLILELSIAKETPRITAAEIIVEEWLQQDFQIEPGREFGISLLRLKRQLSQQSVGILIDNLEPALDRDGRIIDRYRSYVELLRVLTDRQLITSRDRICEIDLDVTHYRLSGLDLDTWQTYFQYRQIEATTNDLQPLHYTYGGNAKAMSLIAGNIITDLDGDFQTYLNTVGRASRNENRDIYAVETGLKQLIATQFDRLQQLDPDAYRLLCRAGCYRDREIGQIEIDALSCLLWDIEPERQIQVVNSLKNRSLIEFQHRRYWLHPAVRAEAIVRLHQTEDWHRTERQAARYWTDMITKIVDLKSALTALEAYYHYLEINDLPAAARVLLQPRENQWGQFLPLASSLYRLGLIQPALTAISCIVIVLPLDRQTAELHNILGDLYWIIGRVREAISTQQYSIEYINSILTKPDLETSDRERHYLIILNLDSLLSIGLYHIDLWELTEASQFFDRIVALASNTTHDRWTQKAIVCLALVHSYLDRDDEARKLLAQIEPLILQQQLTGSSAYFLQHIGQTYVNLGELDRAHFIYQQTLDFCQTGNYLQIQGRTLNGLAQIYRHHNKFPLSQTTHQQAIDILDRLGAKCDLAEAYYQAGLTQSQAGDRDRADIYYNHARQLFLAIDAPQQIARLEVRG
jgi:tetratricopeptide (TPR) repeat protein